LQFDAARKGHFSGMGVLRDLEIIADQIDERGKSLFSIYRHSFIAWI
jgi:hypothetical protein